MAINLTTEEREIITKILATHLPTAQVWLFGSRATGNAHPTSDLDLLVVDSQPLSLQMMADLRLAFSASYLPFTVDIVDGQTASPDFLQTIRGSQVLLQ